MLGVNTTHHLSSALSDANNTALEGFYLIDSNITQHVPDYRSAGYCVLWAIGIKPKDGIVNSVQFIFSGVGNYRFRMCLGVNWTEWQDISTNIPSFYKNFADLSALTIGVQGFSYQSIRNEHTDLNNLPMHNIFTSVESTNSNIPTGLNFGHLLHFAYERNTSQYVVQIIFQYNDDAIWFRSKWGDYWKPWKAVTITSV